MVLEIVHKTVFVLMFLMFLYGNYIIFLKLITLKKRPNSTPKELFNFAESFKKGLWFLDFGATTAPLLGLMGTILALIIAFQELSKKGLSGASEISQAIGLALVATAVGIALSLWFYLWFKFFQDRVNHIKGEAKMKILEAYINE